MNIEKNKLKDRIERLAIDRVNAFSPTISPAPKSMDDNEIESVRRALEYYYERGVKELVVQKKYMGSYCDIYLHADITQTYFISRNGYKVDHIDMKEAIGACNGIHAKFDWSVYDVVIIQAEMMPWSVLGKSLILNDFNGYVEAHETHSDYLRQSNLYDKVERVKSSIAYNDFLKVYGNGDVKETKRKYKTHIIRQYTGLSKFKVLDLEAYDKSIKMYNKQIGHYGKEGALHFKPFNILKKVAKDGSEEIVNDNLSYGGINDDVFMHFEIHNDAQLEAKAIEVKEWFLTLTSNMEEGIMVKPRVAFQKDIAPALKVRNDDYLTMIYGVKFMEEFPRYLKKRSIKRKLDCSVNDWMQNWELLKIPYASIQEGNYYYKNKMYDRIQRESIGSQLDPRL